MLKNAQPRMRLGRNSRMRDSMKLWRRCGRARSEGVLHNLQHTLNLWRNLRPADVGAVTDRPRAIDNRPYKYYRWIRELCNRSI